MEKLGKEISSLNYWEKEANNYVNALQSPYHQHRLEVAFDIIPVELYSSGTKIFDFGCGDAIMFPPFIEKEVQIIGCDIAPEMVEIANKKLKKYKPENDLVLLGGVELLKNYEDETFDAILSFNVLAYLSDCEEADFYKQANRLLKKGGFLIVSHSNELFDMFTFNRYTVEFFRKNFECDIKTLILNPKLPQSQPLYNVRENPLSYKYKLLKYGFKEIKQRFSNKHIKPPILLDLDNKDYPSTLDVRAEEEWKLMFTCSTYHSLSIKI